ncbi:uncharacterized protein AKAME5_000630200 [Lates japonicus]|uniref:Immunoglobulin V-set domain-containing protein n=1 Tax=Lates japonicus TaxID=270547 RepID=A0AAD3MHI1_LATJO|nr:uncharacterized protein AKAME5_000630200 [Lates japonicus]
MYKFYVLLVHLFRAYGALLYANIGDNVTLPCLYASGSNNLCCCRSFLQQPVSDSVQPGDSVTLNCTVHTGTSDREHSVYWFKKDTGNSHLGIMYVHTHSSTQCVKGSHPQPNSPEYTGDTQNEESDAAHYVVLDFKKRQGKRQESRKQRSTEEETVYSGVRMTEVE